MTLGLITADKIIPHGSDVALMARVRAGKWVLITQATVSSIAWVLNDLNLFSGSQQVATGTFTVASTVYDTLQQQDGAWTRDGPSVAAAETGYGRNATLGNDSQWGYNFRGVITAGNIPTKGHNYEARVTFTMSDGSVLVLRFGFTTG